MFKDIKNKKSIRYSLIVLIVLVFIWEGKNLYIDIYNIQQTKKIKEIITTMGVAGKEFRTLEEFNQEFNSNISFKNTCPYITKSKINLDYGYSIGYALKSHLIQIRHMRTFYANFNIGDSDYMICENGGCFGVSDFKRKLKYIQKGCNIE